MQTLLNVTKANVCVRRVHGREWWVRVRGRRMVERRSWGMNARDERGVVVVVVVLVGAEVR